jgi:RNA polymerase sigma-70 factor (ECF subfamily)
LKDRARTIEVLHRKYAGVLYDKCVRLLADRQEAEDAVQETFMSAYQSLDQFRYGQSHLPWLFRIATNVCLKFIRTRTRKGALPSNGLDDQKASGPEGTSRLHFRRMLEDLSGSLDMRDGEILVLHFIDGMKQGEIAEVLGISRRSVVKRLKRIREKAGQMLEGADA